MDGVAQQRDVALGPRLEDRGGAVVEVALLDLGLLGHAEDVVDLGRPAFEEGAQVDMTHTGIGPNDAHWYDDATGVYLYYLYYLLPTLLAFEEVAQVGPHALGLRLARLGGRKE